MGRRNASRTLMTSSRLITGFANARNSVDQQKLERTILSLSFCVANPDIKEAVILDDLSLHAA